MHDKYDPRIHKIISGEIYDESSLGKIEIQVVEVEQRGTLVWNKYRVVKDNTTELAWDENRDKALATSLLTLLKKVK